MRNERHLQIAAHEARLRGGQAQNGLNFSSIESRSKVKPKFPLTSFSLTNSVRLAKVIEIGILKPVPLMGMVNKSCPVAMSPLMPSFVPSGAVSSPVRRFHLPANVRMPLNLR